MALRNRQERPAYSSQKEPKHPASTGRTDRTGCILDTLRKMKKQYHITEYMEHAYAYCLDNESTIRGHIEEAEKEF